MSTFSASRQALSIPLIVALVFQFFEEKIIDWEKERGVLFNCMLVNHLWSEEARSILWAISGMEQLSYITSVAPQRQQQYSNYIRSLFYDGYGHDILRTENLSFPRLASLFLYTSRNDENPCSILSLEQFIHPRLTDLSIVIHNGALHLISMEFLECLQNKARQLRALVVRLRDNVPEPDLIGKVLSDRVASLLQTFQLLQTIDWQWKNTICRASFETLGQIKSICGMVLIEIQDSWLDNLCEMAFQNLLSLHCSITGQGMRKLCPYIGEIQHLLLIEKEGSIGLVTVIAKAQFKHLASLSLNLEHNRDVSANDLLQIVKSSPQLEKLVIDVPDEDDGPQGLIHVHDLNDQTVLDLARTLPSLKFLHLFCSSDQADLNESSLVSLGLHCPLLEECCLWARIDWEKLMEEAPPDGWPKLVTLTVDNDMEEVAYRDLDELVKTIATKMTGVVELSFGNTMEKLTAAWSSYKKDRVPTTAD